MVRDGIYAEAEALVDGVRRVIDDEWRWRQLSDGLALFASPGRVRYFRVPLPLPELATVGRRFLVGPLLPMLAAHGHFFVLTIDSDDIRLFKGARFRFHEVVLDSALRAELTMGRPRKREVHAFVADRGGAGARAVFHGIGGGAEDRQESVLQHFHRVDRVVRDVLAGERAPLVLAAVPHRQALYRTANTYPGLLAEGIDGNPRDIPIDLLHRRVWEIAEPELRGAERAAADTYRALRGTGRTANRPEEMLIAAGHGRVDTLFISTDRTWGPAASEGTPLLRLGPSPSPGEQLDLAVLATLQRGGSVFIVPPDRMPDITPGAATFRY